MLITCCLCHHSPPAHNAFQLLTWYRLCWFTGVTLNVNQSAKTQSVNQMKINRLLVFLSVSLGLSSLVSTAQAQCDSYPIAVSAATLAGVSPGTVIANVFNGSQPGGAGWLTWTGDNSDPALIASLTGAGNSDTYINPLNPNDHNLQIGDWVQSKPGVSNSKGVRDALTALEQVEITVPVWDVAAGQGANANYHVAYFAVIRIIGYDIPGGVITAQFIGYSDCNVGAPN
jgi:hypothetical protein